MALHFWSMAIGLVEGVRRFGQLCAGNVANIVNIVCIVCITLE